MVILNWVVYDVSTFTKLDRLTLAKKIIKTETVTITKTQEFSAIGDADRVDENKKVIALVLELIKKYVFSFVKKGESSNGPSD